MSSCPIRAIRSRVLTLVCPAHTFPACRGRGSGGRSFRSSERSPSAGADGVRQDRRPVALRRRPQDPRLPGLNLVPAECLHLTIQGVGYTDETTAESVAAVVDAVRAEVAALSAFDLTFGRPVILGEAIAIPPQPTEPLHQLLAAIRAGTGTAIGDAAVPIGPSRPPDSTRTSQSPTAMSTQTPGRTTLRSRRSSTARVGRGSAAKRGQCWCPGSFTSRTAHGAGTKRQLSLTWTKPPTTTPTVCPDRRKTIW